MTEETRLRARLQRIEDEILDLECLWCPRYEELVQERLAVIRRLAALGVEPWATMCRQSSALRG